MPITAKEGPAVLFWTIVLLVFFFVPYGLMTAELGSTYADTGGIYSWVKRAFGGFWGTQVSWWYWINVGIWLPSVYLMFATLLGQTFDFKVGFWWTVGMAVALIWINFVINVITLDTSKWVTNIAAIITVAIMLVIGVAGVITVMTDGSATEWTSTDMLPSWGSIVLLGVVVYNFLGFELMSSASEEMQDPKRDVPRSIFTRGSADRGLLPHRDRRHALPAADRRLQPHQRSLPRARGRHRVLRRRRRRRDGRSASARCTASSPPWFPGRSVPTARPQRLRDVVTCHRSSAAPASRFRTPVAAATATALVGTFFTAGLRAA